MKRSKLKAIALWLAIAIGTNGYGQVNVGQVFYGQSMDALGKSVSISADGTVLAMSAVEQDMAFFPPFNFPGYVDIYEWQGGTWVQRGNRLTKPGGDERFGNHISLNQSGDIIAIGNTGSDVNANNAGSVEVFQWDGSAWNQLGQSIYGINTNEQYGTVQINAAGNRIATASWLRGYARIYELQGGQWVQLGADILGSSATRFGQELVFNADGDRVAIASPHYYAGGTWTRYGKVEVFEWDGTSWNQMGNDLIGSIHYGYFGERMDFDRDGSTLAICERDATTIVAGTTYSAAGQLYVLDWDGSNWVSRGDTIKGMVTGDRLGVAVALSADGNRMAYSRGDYNEPVNEGSTRIVDWDGSSWNQVGYVSYSGTFSSPGNKRLDMDTAGVFVVEGMEGAVDSLNTFIQQAGSVRVLDLFTPAPTPVVCSQDYNPQVLDYPASIPYQMRITWDRQTITDTLGNPLVVNLYQLHYRIAGDTAWNTIFVPDTQRVMSNLAPNNYEFYVSGLGNDNPSCEASFAVNCATNMAYAYNVFQAPEMGRLGRATVLNTVGGKRKYDIALVNSNGDTTLQANRRLGFFTDLEVDSYSIYVTDAFGCQADSVGQFSINPLDTAWIPYLISASNNPPNGFRPLWNSVPGVLNYQLRILNVTDGVLDTFITGIIDTSLAVTNLTPGKLYRINVRSRYFNGVANVLSAYSNPRSRNLPLAGNKSDESSQVLEANLVQLYPNPANEHVRIVAPKGSRVAILDLNGRELMEKFTTTEETTIEIAHWAAGLYLVSVSHHESITNLRIIKE